MCIKDPPTNTNRYGHMAIHPYPAGLETTWQSGEGVAVLVRPIRPEDSQMEREFVDNLSDESKYFRFMNHMDKISPLLLARFTQIDYDREMAWSRSRASIRHRPGSSGWHVTSATPMSSPVNLH